jgi:hypothetical protein
MYDRDLVESGAFRRIARAIHGSQAGVSFVEIEFTRGHEFETQVSRRHNAEFESQFPPRAKNLNPLPRQARARPSPARYIHRY